MSIFVVKQPIDLSSKTTQQGILSGVFGVLNLATVVLAVISPKYPNAVWIAIGTAVVSTLTQMVKAKIGVAQKDAGEQLALTPESPNNATIVPSHEQPNDPAAIPVVEGSSPVPPVFQPPTK
jgi:hypothetical protein